MGRKYFCLYQAGGRAVHGRAGRLARAGPAGLGRTGGLRADGAPAGPGGKRTYGFGQNPGRQLPISPGRFASSASGKAYLAVVHGCPAEEAGCFRDLLRRDKAERKTYVTLEPGKGVQEAVLSYQVLSRNGPLSLVSIHLQTGRTHQIRAQFSARGLPLVGDRKYSLLNDACPIALWSHKLSFQHPKTGKPLTFCQSPPAKYPWVNLTCNLKRRRAAGSR